MDLQAGALHGISTSSSTNSQASMLFAVFHSVSASERQLVNCCQRANNTVTAILVRLPVHSKSTFPPRQNMCCTCGALGYLLGCWQSVAPVQLMSMLQLKVLATQLAAAQRFSSNKHAGM